MHVGSHPNFTEIVETPKEFSHDLTETRYGALAEAVHHIDYALHNPVPAIAHRRITQQIYEGRESVGGKELLTIVPAKIHQELRL